MKKRGHPEDAVQRAIVDYLTIVENMTLKRVRFFAVPNGGKRSKTEAAIMKGLGVRAGVPDIAVLWVCNKGQPHVGFIEVKSGDGRLSPAQEEFRDWCALAEVPWVLARSVADVQAALKEWKVPRS